MAFNPYFYCDSPRPIELIYKALTELGEIKPTVEQLKVKVDKLIADLDGTIKDEVQRVIDEMYENGEFTDIIENMFNEYFNNVTAPKEFKIDVRREFRVALYSMPYDATNYNNLNYSYCQGGNYFVRNGVKYYIGCYRISLSRNLYYKNDNADIRLYAYIDDKWNYIRHNIYSVGHANDIRYMPHLNKFFVVKSAEFNGGSTEVGSCDVCVIDWNLPAQIDATFTIDLSTIYPRRDRITCIDYFDNKYWALIGSGGVNPVQIFTFDLDIQDNTYIPLRVYEYDTLYISNNAETGYVMQGAGFCQNEDYIFIGNTAPAGIYRFNKRTKALDCFYNIGPYANSHMYPTGEIENLSIIDNEIFIGTAIHGNQRLSYFDYNQVFSFDFVNGLSCPNKAITTYGSYNRNIFVGMEGYPESVDYFTREICNPNGLSGANGMPFPTWEEAALFINAQDLWTTLTLTPISKNVAGYLALDLGKCNVYIDGTTYYNNSTAESELDKYPRIAGITAEGGALDIARVLVMNRAPETAGDYAKYQVLTRFNSLNMHNCALIPYLRPTGSKLVMINRGFANLGTIYTTGNSVVSWDNDNMDMYICSINTHNHYTGSSSSGIIG